MTCINAIVHGGKVYLGGDSAGVSSYQMTVRLDEKVFRNGDFGIGCCGSFRMRDLLRYKFVPPPRRMNEDLDRYIRTSFVDSVIACFQENKFATTEKEVVSGGSFFVAIEGRLFHIQNDYQVGEPLVQYDAIGNADDIAIGALFATKGMDISPQRRLEIALQAAEAHTTDVRNPFHFLEI